MRGGSLCRSIKDRLSKYSSTRAQSAWDNRVKERPGSGIGMHGDSARIQIASGVTVFANGNPRENRRVGFVCFATNLIFSLYIKLL